MARDRSQKTLPDLGIEPPIWREGTEKISEAASVEPLNCRVPANDRGAEQVTRIGYEFPALAGVADLLLERRMSPVRIARAQLFVKVGGLGVHLRLVPPAHHDVPDQCHPAVPADKLVRAPPADLRIDPMPRRRGDESIEPASPVVPLLERRYLDLHVGKLRQPLACNRRQPFAWFNGNDVKAKGGKRTSCLSGSAADLEHRRALRKAGNVDEIGKQLVRVPRPHAIVEVRDLVEHTPECTSIRRPHPLIVSPRPTLPLATCLVWSQTQN